MCSFPKDPTGGLFDLVWRYENRLMNGRDIRGGSQR